MRKDTAKSALKRAGYEVTACIGYRNGERTIVAYMATKMNRCYKAKSITGLYNEVHKKVSL